MPRTTQPSSVRVDTRDGVATVTLDNPPVNALSDAVFESLLATLEGLGEDVRAVVLTGSGEKAFAAGADLGEFARMLDEPGAIEAHTELTRAALATIEALPAPVIAAVQASAVGGGLELALACDLVVADERARLGLPEVRLALIPGAGGTQRLSRRVGSLRATELVLTGRLMRAREALDIGLVTSVAPAGKALATAMEQATELAARSAPAVQAAKRALRAGADRELAAGLDEEQRQFRSVLTGDDAREGVAAFLEGRRPVFRHR